MFEYFYNEIFRKTIIGFGTLFNDLTIKQEDSTVKVPLAYGPTQKFLARLEESPDLSKRTSLTLPRMSFEFTGLNYDPSRKVTTTQQITVKDPNDGSVTKSAYMPVPYNMQFELSIMTKLNDDALQIVEQILPYFQPSFNLTIDLIDSIGEKRDIPVVLDNISFEDDYEGDFSSRRALIYTLNFTAKTYLFGPIADSTDGLIKKVQVDYYSSIDRETARRQLRYTASPQALQDYDNDNTTVLKEDTTKAKTRLVVDDSSALAVGNRIIIDTEIMKIKEIPDSKTLVVYRGYNSTTKAIHVTGASIDVLTAADDALVDPDDDFGFNGFIEDFNDGGTFSPTRQEDLM